MRTALGGALLGAAILLIARGCDDASVTAKSSPARPLLMEPAAPVATGTPAPERQLVAADEPSPPPPPPPAAPSDSEVPDLEVRDWLTVRVVDVHQMPIRDAQLSLDGLRKPNDGSWYGMRGDASVGKTDAQGQARIDYTRWVDIDGKATAVDLTVRHPDFIVFRDSHFAITKAETTVVLQRGAMVRLTAWCRTRTLIVRDITISTDWRIQLPDSAWRRDPDGTCSTTRIPPGPHLVQVRHRSEELGEVHSRIVAFTLDERQQLLDVDVELRPLVTLRGKLDPAVPRPVVGGHVMLQLFARCDRSSLSTEHEALVEADGSFALADVPEGSGQLIAWCPGWVSRQTARPESEVDRKIPAIITDEDRRSLLAARLAVDAGPPAILDASAQDVVVAMERTCGLEVLVVDRQGAPLSGIEVVTSPNVNWRDVGSTIFPWGTWQAKTDSDGLARIQGLPPDPELFVGIDSKVFQLQRADRDRTPTVAMRSGETFRRELMVERVAR